jgi:hypothetical protein
MLREMLGSQTAAPIWTPHPGPQTEAMRSEADELFYGGAAGGGKSDLLLGLALTQHRRSLILRREYTQLVGVGGLIERSRELLGGTSARYNGSEHVWWHIPGGRALGFGGIEQQSDVWKYAGKPRDLLCFDEVSHFTRDQYRTMRGWVRTTVPWQRTRVVATGNPPTTPEGEWVVEHWAPWLDPTHPRPAEPGELRWFATIDGAERELPGPEPIEHAGETIQPKSRTFIPARLEDNPSLGVAYRSELQAMPEPLRTQLLYGDFGLTLEDHPWQVIPTEWIRLALERWTGDRSSEQGAVGIDCARGGADQQVLASLRGVCFDKLQTWRGKDVPDGPAAAGLLAPHIEPSATAYVDVIGVGSSVYDQLRQQGVRCIAVNSAESAPEHARDRTGRLRPRNMRSWAWWSLREALDPETGMDVALPPDRALAADLATPRYRIIGTDMIAVEPKEDIIKRLGRSPDRGDAVCYAWLGVSCATPVGYHSVQGRRIVRRRGAL